MDKEKWAKGLLKNILRYKNNPPVTFCIQSKALIYDSYMTNTITLALLLLAACNISLRDTSQTLFVNELQIEYLTDPLGIDTETPRFSWRLSDKNDTRGQKQTAYQVLVASEKSLLNDDQADIWNSSKVSGNQSALVPYGGKKLISGQQYFWKVRVWDKNIKPSPWSSVAHFSMGLLEQDDWKDSWIMHPDAAAEKHIWYRKNLKLDQELQSAFLHVASLGYHELYVNGEKVGDQILVPTLTRLDKRVHYVTYDIADMLMQGTNTVALWYGPGWSRYDAGPIENVFGVRYITIEGLKRRPGLSDITGYDISTDLKQTSLFYSSSQLFNQIYQTDLWTYRANTIEGYTADCLHRERLGYGEHAFTNAWGCGLPSYRSGAFLTKYVRDWADGQEENGWINYTAPQINRHFGGPMWSSGGLNVSWEFYQIYGDKQILEFTYDAGKRWIEFLDSQMSDGVLQPFFSNWGRFLGDWAAPNGRSVGGDIPDALFFNNCVYAMNLTTLIEIANILGKSDDAALFGSRLEEIKKRVHEHFFDKEKQVYMNGRQVEQAFPLMIGLVPEHLRPVVFSNFEKEITQTRPYLDAGSSGLPILLKYLIEDVERSDILFTHISGTSYPSYGYFLERGETTWPEHWRVDVESRIHSCYIGISAWFIKKLGGIRPDPEKPGYQDFLIKPQIVVDLTHVETATESLYGLIESNWNREVESSQLYVTIPVNSSATVYMPTKDVESLLESGQPIGQTKGVEIIKTEDNCAVLKVESGKYEFFSSAAL